MLMHICDKNRESNHFYMSFPDSDFGNQSQYVIKHGHALQAFLFCSIHIDYIRKRTGILFHNAGAE